MKKIFLLLLPLMLLTSCSQTVKVTVAKTDMQRFLELHPAPVVTLKSTDSELTNALNVAYLKECVLRQYYDLPVEAYCIHSKKHDMKNRWIQKLK